MNSSSKFRHVALLLAVVLVAVGGWLIWKSQAGPIYAGSHSHTSDSHEHEHTHGGDLDHGHEHSGQTGSETHSHAHRHGHQHSSPSGEASSRGLTEVGHLHGAQEKDTKLFWAKATVADGQVELVFFRQDGNEKELVDYRPSAASFSAKLFNGSKHEGDLEITRDNDRFVGSMPDDFFCLPTHVIRFSNLLLGGETFEAAVPLTKSEPAEKQESQE